MEECFEDPLPRESNQEDIGKWKAASAGAATGTENNSGDFDCNICLDIVQEPVVTFCGHLYCWPCIYRWLQSKRTSYEDPDHQLQCPVCKAQVSENALIPLYGRGQSGKQSDSKGIQPGMVVPQRPDGPGCGVHTLLAATSTNSHSHPSQEHHYGSEYPYHDQQVHPYYNYPLGHYSRSPAFGFAGTTTFHPMIGMFGEMIYARIFGNSQTTLYAYPNTYSVGTTSSARARRNVIQAERSLNRISFFLVCCILLCLLLF